MDAALQLLHTARQAVENATEDKAARKVRSGEEAQRQQDAIRRIGRILSQVKVEAEISPADGCDVAVRATGASTVRRGQRSASMPFQPWPSLRRLPAMTGQRRPGGCSAHQSPAGRRSG
ncbi:hypothetical protein [Streptomyces virginiae]|uniref:hypothetical protein n=1 Tax=Streptomyces virginiae TaxID=1961 RepID=UPI0030E16F4A